MLYKRYSIGILNEDIKEKLKRGRRYRINKNKMMRRKITNILKELGIPASIKGYHYIREAILMVISNQEIMSTIGKSIYTKLANEHNTNKCAVERAIRTAIERGISSGNIEIIQNIFGYTINPNKGKPTNKEFIATIADKVKLEMKTYHI